MHDHIAVQSLRCIEIVKWLLEKRYCVILSATNGKGTYHECAMSAVEEAGNTKNLRQ